MKNPGFGFSLLRGLRRAGLVLVALAIALYFGATDENFRDLNNLLDRTRHWVEVGLIAIPMTFIIASGGIDLSVGSLLALCGLVAGLCAGPLGWPLPLALAAGVGVGIAGGALNGLIIGRLRVPALVVTLATMAIYRGITLGLSQGQSMGAWPMGFTDWGSLGAFELGEWYVPHQLLLLLLAYALGIFVFNRTRAGRWALQLGENQTAARHAAVPVPRVQFWLYAACGLVTGAAAMIYTARFATAHPEAARGLELEAIACVVIGGTRITGGGGSVFGTLLGLVIIGLLRFGMDMRGVAQERQIILIGALLIVTAIINGALARRAA